MKYSINKIILWGIIILNSLAFLGYGLAKLSGLQFTQLHFFDNVLLKDVKDQAIMWHFFGLKRGYAVLIGLGEIIPAILILFKRTRFIGAFIYLIVVINILAINVFFGITNVTLFISLILTSNSIVILYSERSKIAPLLSR